MSLINGVPSDQLATTDRGLQYGDGLFETIAVRHGEPQLWDLHMTRLQQGCKALCLPMVDIQLLNAEAQRVCRHATNAVLKIILTRGSGGRGYQVQEAVEPTRILSVHPCPDYPEEYSKQGIRVRFCNLRLARQPALAGIKHLNRLEQVLARQEWQDPDIVEGLLRDSHDEVIEGVMSNLFMVRAGKLFTPDLTHCGVAGVMRERVMRLAESLGLMVHIQALVEQDLYGADELFVTNSLIGIWPVRQLEQRPFPVGPVTQQLQQLLVKHD